jgi:O-antigen ligase
MRSLGQLFSRIGLLAVSASAFLISFALDAGPVGYPYWIMLTVFAVGSFTVSNLIRGPLKVPSQIELSAGFFLVWVSLSFFWSIAPQRTLSAILSYCLAFALMSCALRVGKSIPWWRFLGLAYITGCAIAAFVVISNGFSFVSNSALDARSTVGDLNANYVAYAVSTALPIAITLILDRPGRNFGNYALLAFLGLGLVAIMFSGSRGALLGVLTALSFYALTKARRNLGKALLAVVMIGALLFFILDYLPLEVRQRLDFIAYLASDKWDIDFSGREELWPFAISEIYSNPLQGIGAYAFQEISPLEIPVHNVLLTIAVESGLIGLFLYFRILYLVLRKLLRSENKAAKIGGVLLFLVWIPMALTGVWEFAAPAWFAFGWMVGAANHMPAEVKRAEHRRFPIPFAPNLLKSNSARSGSLEFDAKRQLDA